MIGPAIAVASIVLVATYWFFWFALWKYIGFLHPVLDVQKSQEIYDAFQMTFSYVGHYFTDIPLVSFIVKLFTLAFFHNWNVNLNYFWSEYSSILESSSSLNTFYLSVFVPAFPALGLGALIFKTTLNSTKKEKIIHDSGRKISDSVREAATSQKSKIKTFGRGIRIHPKVYIDKDRETRHFGVVGAQGSGKTRWFIHFLNEIIDRGDRILIYDNKNDYTKILPVENNEIGLIAPWDKRSLAWDIARDVQNIQHVEDFAARLIPDSKEPIWSNAARSVMSGMIRRLNYEKPGKWNFRDLFEMATNNEVMASAVEKFKPSASNLVSDPNSKVAQNIFGNIASAMFPVEAFAISWNGLDPYDLNKKVEPKNRKFAFNDWLSDDWKSFNLPRVLVLQGNKGYARLEEVCIQSMITVFASIMNSSKMPDSRERRVWVFIDELPQPGKLPYLDSFFAVGRSKGVCMVVGFQNFPQLIEIYGINATNSLAELFGTVTFMRSSGEGTRKFVHGLTGERMVQRYLGERETEFGSSPNYRLEKVPVITDIDLTSLKVDKKGVEGLVFFGDDSNIFKLKWPFIDWPEVRPGQVDAAWCADLKVREKNEDFVNLRPD